MYRNIHRLRYLRCENTDVGGRRLDPTCIVFLTVACSRRDLKGNRRKLLCVTTAMYTATFIYWVVLVVSQFQTLHVVERHSSDDHWWLDSVTTSLIPPSECFPGSSTLPESSQYCTSAQAPQNFQSTDGWAITQGDCIGTATLTFNVRVFSDLAHRAPT